MDSHYKAKLEPKEQTELLGFENNHIYLYYEVLTGSTITTWSLGSLM